MMKKSLILLLGAILFCSCGDFLKEFSKELAYARNCKDLDEILIGNGYMTQQLMNGAGIYGSVYFPYLQVMDDDVDLKILGTRDGEAHDDAIQTYMNFYGWSNQLNINPSQDKEWDDLDWKRMYSHIGYLNVIIAEVKKYTQDSIEIRDRVEGEARFLRGAYYYLLVNMYANPYDKKTAERELGIPIKLTENIEDKYYSRNSIAECYAAIVDDLKVAADKLSGMKQATFYRVNEAAARVLLSRVYLYMGEWQLALDECGKVMKLDGVSLMDLNSFDADDDGTNVLDENNPEILFTQGTSIMNTFKFDLLKYGETYGAFACSDDLLSLYRDYEEDVEDLRVDRYIRIYPGEVYMPGKVRGSYNSYVYDGFVIRSAEVFLNKAEAEAMLDKGEAIQTIKVLLEKRFRDMRIPTIDGLKGEKLIKFIREERRRELSFECHRWFDLRRYAVSPKYADKKAVRHNVYERGAYKGYYTLKPYGEDAAWVLPIPGFEIVYNQGAMVDNPERVKRELK